MKFFIPCDPPRATAQQKKVYRLPNGQTRAVEPEHVVAARKFFLLAIARFSPAAPLDGPLKSVIAFTWPWTSDDTKRMKIAGWRWKMTSPDWDNIPKILCDCMTKRGFYHNDGQIAQGTVIKRHGNNPGIWVQIEQLRQPYEIDEGQGELKLD